MRCTAEPVPPPALHTESRYCRHLAAQARAAISERGAAAAAARRRPYVFAKRVRWRGGAARIARNSTQCKSSTPSFRRTVPVFFRHTVRNEPSTDAVTSTRASRVVNRSGYYPTRTGPDQMASGFGPQTQIPGPGICFPPITRTGPNVPGPDRMQLYLGSVTQNI